MHRSSVDFVMDFLQISFYLVWAAICGTLIAQDIFHKGWVNGKLVWVLLGITILYNILFNHEISLAFNLVILAIMLFLNYLMKLPFADLVVFNSVGSFFPQYFLFTVGASVIACSIYRYVKKVPNAQGIPFIPFILLSLFGAFLVFFIKQSFF